MDITKEQLESILKKLEGEDAEQLEHKLRRKLHALDYAKSKEERKAIRTKKKEAKDAYILSIMEKKLTKDEQLIGLFLLQDKKARREKIEKKKLKVKKRK